MRYFKLRNSSGVFFDITNEEYLFHEISGLGFEETNEFRRVGPVWKLTSSIFSQVNPSGKMLFTEFGNTTPYEKYTRFKRFIVQAPLDLIYYPDGITGKSYRKKVRVSRLDKTEMTELGVLDCDIEFTPYSPWYEIVTIENIPEEVVENAHWIWDVGNRWRDSVDEDSTASRYMFGGESRNDVFIDCESNTQGLVKLIIDGPARNPSWLHYVDSMLESSGGFSSNSSIMIKEGEQLIIDNTEGTYAITVHSSTEDRNVYSLRDFDKKCFFNLEAGRNRFVVTSEDGVPVHMLVEGHIHYATV